MSHQLMAANEWDDAVVPSTVGTSQDDAPVPVPDEAVSAESDNGAAPRTGSKRPSSGGSSSTAARLETVSETGGQPPVPAIAAASRQPQPGLGVVPELDAPRPGSAVHAAQWPQASAENDERPGVDIEMVARGEAAQQEQEADSAWRGGVGSEPSAAPAREGESRQRQTRSWFFTPSERSHGDQVWSATICIK